MKNNFSFSLYNRIGQRKYMNSQERSKYLIEAKKSDVEKRLFLLMLYYSGARISEVLNLKVAQIDRTENMVIIETLKKRRKGVYRALPLPSGFAQELKKLILLNSIEKRIWKFSRRTGLSILTPKFRTTGLIGKFLP